MKRAGLDSLCGSDGQRFAQCGRGYRGPLTPALLSTSVQVTSRRQNGHDPSTDQSLESGLGSRRVSPAGDLTPTHDVLDRASENRLFPPGRPVTVREDTDGTLPTYSSRPRASFAGSIGPRDVEFESLGLSSGARPPTRSAVSCAVDAQIAVPRGLGRTARTRTTRPMTTNRRGTSTVTVERADDCVGRVRMFDDGGRKKERGRRAERQPYS